MYKKEFIKGLFNGSLKWVNHSFSQEGEDLILDELLGHKNEGFYIDIGAYHPFQFSNTRMFYNRGWHGINVDVMPETIKLFNKFRTRDINIEAAIASKNKKISYYIYKEKALNTCDEDRVEYLKQNGYMPVRKIYVETYTIMEILNKYVEKNQKIDFIDIDIEGMDEEVIEQMDFNKYCPTIIMTENLKGEKQNIIEKNGYKLKAFTTRTALYVKGK